MCALLCCVWPSALRLLLCFVCCFLCLPMRSSCRAALLLWGRLLAAAQAAGSTGGAHTVTTSAPEYEAYIQGSTIASTKQHLAARLPLTAALSPLALRSLPNENKVLKSQRACTKRQGKVHSHARNRLFAYGVLVVRLWCAGVGMLVCCLAISLYCCCFVALVGVGAAHASCLIPIAASQWNWTGA